MALTLPSLNGQPSRACPKPESRKRVKGWKDRAEAKQIKTVRATCVERDGKCRVFKTLTGEHGGWAILGALVQLEMEYLCDGPSEWAHMHSRRRSQTRNQSPEQRHDTAHSLMLCRFHHAEYDAHRLHITALTRKGADGPLKFRRAK